MSRSERQTRWVNAGERFFPAPKYNFDRHLTRKGDWVVLDNLSYKEAKKFRDAAYFWAWRRRYKVKLVSTRVGNDLYEVRCTLIDKKAIRDFGDK